jgi:dipicolinate synthase subunit A
VSSKVAILGGDQREVRVAELLNADGHDVAVFGLGLSGSEEIHNSPTVEDAVTDREWIICPAPGLGENDQLYAPNASEPLFLSESLLRRTAASKGGLVVGLQSPSLAEVAGRLGIPIHEFKGDRALAVVVASAVAEALVAELIGLTNRILREIRVTVLGYGATGSAIADALVALGCGTSVASRDVVQLEVARRRGAKAVRLGDWTNLLSDTDVLVNTIPNPQIVGPDLYPMLAHKTVIDISSPPGGLDHEAARSAGVTVIWARGLAGLRAPLTIGEAQYEFIRRAMSGPPRTPSKGTA